MSSAEIEAETITVESSSERKEMRNSFVENRAKQRESMMNVHSESQLTPSTNVSNNGFTNTERVRCAQDNVMQASDASERSTTAGQSYIYSEDNTEVQSR